jgi:alkylhydroperoxidase family enzyme
MMGGAEAEPLRLFRTVAHNAHVLDKLRSTGSYLLNFGCVDPLEREIVILRTCARCRSEYEWGVHVAVFARTVGLSDRQIVATTLDEGEAGVWTERQAALIRLADELHERSTVSDALWAELIGWWTPPQLVELVALAGQYHAVSYLTNAFSVQLEDFAARLPSQGAHPTSSSASPSVVR